MHRKQEQLVDVTAPWSQRRPLPFPLPFSDSTVSDRFVLPARSAGAFVLVSNEILLRHAQSDIPPFRSLVLDVVSAEVEGQDAGSVVVACWTEFCRVSPGVGFCGRFWACVMGGLENERKGSEGCAEAWDSAWRSELRNHSDQAGSERATGAALGEGGQITQVDETSGRGDDKVGGERHEGWQRLAKRLGWVSCDSTSRPVVQMGGCGVPWFPGVPGLSETLRAPKQDPQKSGQAGDWAWEAEPKLGHLARADERGALAQRVHGIGGVVGFATLSQPKEPGPHPSTKDTRTGSEGVRIGHSACQLVSTHHLAWPSSCHLAVHAVTV